MNESSGIYKIVNKENGNFYIGCASNFSTRWSVHVHELNKGKHHNAHLQHAWNKYGRDAFEFIVIEECGFDILIEREQFYLDTLHPQYNIAPNAGSLLGYKRGPQSPEHRAKNGDARRGKKLRPESIAKRSAKMRGRKRPAYAIKASADGQRGKKRRPLTVAEKEQRRITYTGKKKDNASSHYIGVHWDAKKSKFVSQMCVRKKQSFLGHFDNEIDAARIRDRFAISMLGLETITNFPISDYPNELAIAMCFGPTARLNYPISDYLPEVPCSSSPK